MTRLVSMPPAAQLAPLLTAYSQAAAAQRRQLVLGLALVAIALAVSAVGAEVRPVTLWNKIGNFTSYFDRLLKLDSGMRVWTDPQEWLGLGALEQIARRNRADRLHRHTHGRVRGFHLCGSGQPQPDALCAGSVHGAARSGILPLCPGYRLCDDLCRRLRAGSPAGRVGNDVTYFRRAGQAVRRSLGEYR